MFIVSFEFLVSVTHKDCPRMAGGNTGCSQCEVM